MTEPTGYIVAMLAPAIGDGACRRIDSQLEELEDLPVREKASVRMFGYRYRKSFETFRANEYPRPAST